MIDDRRGGGGGLGGRLGGGLPFPMKAGGGVLGIIVLLASLLLPKLMGGGSNAASVPTPQVKTGDAADTCSSDLEQVVCGATVDVQTYWQTNLPAFFGTDYEVTKTV
ncbi:MAG: hypothetical protein M3P52_10720, partial [Actinomycetota bacterium]|nr:hypothetical protein [Actinomycetota bacterium]